MTTSRHYSLLVPRLDRTGPCNVAVDVARAAQAAGWTVQALYLSGDVQRDDLQGFAAVRRFTLSDLFTLQGVVHTHCLRPDLVGALLKLNRRCRVLTTLHNHFLVDLGFDHARWKVRLSWQVWRRAIAWLDHRVCISNAMRRDYRRLLPGLSFDLVYNFRPAARPAPVSADSPAARWLQAQREAGRLRLVYVGSISARKNLLPMMAALAAAPQLSLVVCGQGPLADELAAAVRQHGLDERVLLLGQVARPETVVAQADVLVLPSLAEGLPLVAIEAARLGVPCLLSNIAVHRELAALGLGVTFDRHRYSDFSASAQRAFEMRSPAGRQQIVDAWQRHFAPEVGFQRYEQLFEAGR